MSRFTVIASYPKSGSTWLRAVLESLRNGGQAVDINRNMADVIAAADRNVFDRHMGIAASELLPLEIAWGRPDVWRHVAKSAAPRDRALTWVKIHDALIAPASNFPEPFPADLISAAIHVVRDPRDVVISFAHHFGVDIDTAIDWMNNAEAVLDRPETGLPVQLPQMLSSWSNHVKSWLDAPGLKVHLVRYEDMHAKPREIVQGVADFLNLPYAPPVIASAIAATQFDVLRAQEDRAGFKEREAHMDRFFRRGQAGGWRNILSADQAARIAHDHDAAMKRLDYAA